MNFTKLHKMHFQIIFLIKHAVEPLYLLKLALFLVASPTVTQTLTIYNLS